MAVALNDRRDVVQASSDGQTVFTVNFPAATSADVGAVLEDGTPATVTGWVPGANGNSGTATLAAGVPLGVNVVFFGQGAVERTGDLTDGGDFFAAPYNAAQDRVFLLLQDLRRDVDRTFRLAMTDSGVGPQIAAVVANALTSATLPDFLAAIGAVSSVDPATMAAPLTIAGVAPQVGLVDVDSPTATRRLEIVFNNGVVNIYVRDADGHQTGHVLNIPVDATGASAIGLLIRNVQRWRLEETVFGPVADNAVSLGKETIRPIEVFTRRLSALPGSGEDARVPTIDGEVTMSASVGAGLRFHYKIPGGGVINYALADIGSGSGASDLVNDLTPQLGGNLDLNGFTVGGVGAADLAKLPNIALTAPVDLDALAAQVGGLTSAVVLKGTWSPAGGVFPGNGTAQAGWSYIATTAGTVDGVAFAVNDRVIALQDNAATGTAAHWLKQAYSDAVLSVAGLTGAIAGSALVAALPVASGAAAGVMSAAAAAKVGHLTVTGPVDLDAIEAGAQVNPTDAEIATSYHSAVPVASQAEAEAGTGTAIRTFTPQRIAQAIAALGGGGGGGLTVVSGAGAPSAAPPAVGALYRDTASRDLYIARDTASAGEWVLLTEIGSDVASMTELTADAVAVADALYVRTAAGQDRQLDLGEARAWMARAVVREPTAGEISAGSLTLNLADGDGGTIPVDSGAAFTVNVPLFATVAIPVGGQVAVVREGAGAVTIAWPAGVTINGVAGPSTAAIASRWQSAVLLKRAQNRWTITGHIA